MFRSLSPGHHQVTRNWNLRMLHAIIHNVSYISLKFNEILYNSFYELQCVASSNFSFLWPDDGLVIEAETCCHLIILNKINIYNSSGVLTYKNFTPYLYNEYQQILNLVEIGQYIGRWTRRAMFVLLLPAKLSNQKTAHLEWNYMGCYENLSGKNITRTLYNFTFYYGVVFLAVPVPPIPPFTYLFL
jgi:hypothetical protein